MPSGVKMRRAETEAGLRHAGTAGTLYGEGDAKVRDQCVYALRRLLQQDVRLLQLRGGFDLTQEPLGAERRAEIRV